MRQFEHKRGFSLLRHFDVIFVELMGPSITHLEHFDRGVVEHPQLDSCAEGVPGALAKGGSHAVFHVPILDI